MILCVGEILADLIVDGACNCDGAGFGEARQMDILGNLGGAPLNVASSVVRDGGEGGFVGRVGKDVIGARLRSLAQGLGLSYLNIQTDEDRSTTLAFVNLSSDGERSFSFFRRDTADSFIELPVSILQQNPTIINFGSLLLTNNSTLQNVLQFIGEAKSKGIKIGFDVNLRESIFPSKSHAINAYSQLFPFIDIIKFSEDELEYFAQGVSHQQFLCQTFGKNVLIVVTMGLNGSKYYYNSQSHAVPTVAVKAVDTTGAGDAFWGVFLNRISRVTAPYQPHVLTEILQNANRAGADATQYKGAIRF